MLVSLLGAAAWPSAVPAQSVDNVQESSAGGHRSLDELSARERVGQLFLVAHFASGDDPLQDVRRLIVDYGLGGVVLQSGNNVFKNDGDTNMPATIAEHVEALQRTALEAGSGIPLFVAVDQEGDGAPFTHLRAGFTPLPSSMAIGATWRHEDAEAIGRIVGEELAAVGVNVLLGPVLDVLAEPSVDTGGDIGTRAFGGHPFWVAQMGSAYVRGVHIGGNWRVMTVAKHFPGHGGSDRLPDQEVATVVKDLAALSTIELPPFGAVTASSPGDRDFAAVSEALMTSHIRYAGLQGNLQRRTGPISFDREGLKAVLNLEPFAFDEWRAAGGLIVSDSLGVPAVRRWFSPLGEPFANRRIARDALMAGNDVLTIAQFADVQAWSVQMANIVDTLDYFERQYVEDRAFAERVDDAVRRIIARKRVLIPDWTVEGYTGGLSLSGASASGSAPGGEVSRAIVDGVVRRAVTAWRNPERPPSRGDSIVVITPRDPSRGDGGHLACDDEPCGIADARHRTLQTFGPTLVEQLMIERYGPGGTGVVNPGLVTPLAFCELEHALSPEIVPAPTPATEDESTLDERVETPSSVGGCDSGLDRQLVLERLRTADWIVFAFGTLNPDEVRLLRGLLLTHAGRIAAATGARLAVLSFGPPYLIDATNFSGLDAYVTAYTKIPTAVEAAIGVLFGDLEAPGHSPVTVEEAGYRLSERLQPPTGARFPMMLTEPPPIAGAQPPTKIGLEIGPIVDSNGNPVPDRSVVEIVSVPEEAIGGVGPVTAQTIGGIARIEINLLLGGETSILASMGDGVSAQEPVVVRLAEPTIVAHGGSNGVLAPSHDISMTVEAEISNSGPAYADATSGPVNAERLGPSDLLFSSIAILVLSMAAAARLGRGLGAFVILRTGLTTAVGGLGGYVLYASLVLVRALDRPGIKPFDGVSVSLLGAAAGIGLGLMLFRRSRPATALNSGPSPQS